VCFTLNPFAASLSVALVSSLSLASQPSPLQFTVTATLSVRRCETGV
jgi:hypothetical protein